jgi:tRNA threonylcarbamoyladenosine biosynthesis protein TsaE
MEEEIIAVASLDDLPEVATAILNFAKEHTILLFRGEMAAGKTTLIKEIGRQAGVEEPISSPTYAIVNEYQRKNGKELFHFDFYRINDEKEALDIGATEYFASGQLCLIEWPARIENLLPENFVEVVIDKGIGEARTITLKKK